jgi:hypothetical protein
MAEPRQFFLVRMIRGRERFEVFPLREPEPSRCWKFGLGVAIIGPSLSEALELGHRLLGRRDE